ncbi:MAG: NADH-quinone oxidoreductase subunit NuoF [Bacillota bacterium]|jgi:NADH:ubiquinone oxidoreductase subunit F (NADH-binding)/(2Fe-2S) ferredoxin/Pyruvate/2-oxoacid:ferredoxin oxidoreductase delta subunit
MAFVRSHILVCGGTGCHSSGSSQLQEALRDALRRHSLQDEVKIVETGCFGFCKAGPIVMIYPEAAFYCHVALEDAEELVSEHLVKGRIVERLLYREPVTDEAIALFHDIGFYQKQHRQALRNCGKIAAECIDEYIAADGYQALVKALTAMTPTQVIDEVKRSGLRGRGGAGFPTGLKWELAAQSQHPTKFVVCNADEGDPGAFMDRSILEGDPHSIIEAMAIAGYAIGASQGYVYVRAEYPIAVERLSTAIKAAREAGILGESIFGSGFSFDLGIRLGAGAFVCGEETALLTSIEGHRGTPRPRPPYPATSGLWGRPTLINNVETFANIPLIILHGADEFARIGTETSKGTKVFALAGNVNNTGLVEVPMGTTLREIVYDIGGGIPGGKAFKACQIGGPSGGCLPAELLDTRIDYDSLRAVGAMMGSGGLIVMDEATCMVDVARFFLEFTQDESCGKCIPCREGTKRMLEILERITRGEGKEEDIGLLEELAEVISKASLCGLGQTAPNPVLATLRFFRDEYEAHIKERRCPAGVCQALLSYSISAQDCRGCGLCKKVCPVGAISGEIRQPHVIDTSKCIKCGACLARCPFKAISR